MATSKGTYVLLNDDYDVHPLSMYCQQARGARIKTLGFRSVVTNLRFSDVMKYIKEGTIRDVRKYSHPQILSSTANKQACNPSVRMNVDTAS